MPRRVDTAQRRAEIAALVVDIIQREGAASATVRRVSEAGGFSVGVITHYFADKDELIAFAFDWLAERSFTQLATVLRRVQPGLPRLQAALEFMVPLAQAHSFPAVWLSLWSGAMHNRRLALVHRRYYARWRGILAQCLDEAAESGEIAEGACSADTIDLLAAGVDGLWLAVTFEGARFSGARRRRLVAQLMERLVGCRVSPGASVAVPRERGRTRARKPG
jgi:AcrR family transcriptional regulator